MEVHKATLSELPQIYANVHETWPHHMDLQTHVDLRLASPKHQRARWYYLKINNEITATLGAYPFAFRIDDAIFQGIGIGAVHTPTKWRKQGLASHLINTIHEIMKGEGATISHLYSDITPHYYERFGYQKVPCVLVQVSPGETNLTDHYALEPVDPSHQLPSQIYARIQRHASFRDAEHWQWLKAKQASDLIVIIRNSSREPVGYMNFAAIGGEPYLIDHTIPQSCPWQDFKNLLQRAMKIARYKTHLTCWMKPEYVKDEQDIKPFSHEIPMICALDPNLDPETLTKLWFFPVEHI